MFNPEASAYDDEERNKDHAIPFFMKDLVELTAQTEATGQPVYAEREMVEIRHPGDRSYVQREVVTMEHKRRWPQHYAAFAAGQEAPLSGHPISEWPAINKAQVLSFQFMGIRTVEELAELPDDVVGKIGTGGMTLRSKAKAWLESAKDGAAVLRAASENEALRAQLAAMQEQLAALTVPTKPARAKLSLSATEAE